MRSKLYTRNWLLILLFFIVFSLASFFYSYNLNTNGDTYGAALSASIGTSLLVGSIFTLLYQIFQENDFKDHIKESIEIKHSALQDEIAKLFSSYNEIYLPNRIFERNNDSNPDFDLDLNSEINSSRDYFFRGISGKRVPIRIKEANKNIENIKLILLNPLNEKALSNRIGYYYKTDSSTQLEQELDMSLKSKYKNQIIENIFLTIYGLYQVRNWCLNPIIVKFSDSQSTSRIEILDKSLFLASFSDENHFTKHPITLKYSSKSYFYSMLRREFLAEFDVITKEIILISKEMEAENLKEKMDELAKNWSYALNFDEIKLKYQTAITQLI